MEYSTALTLLGLRSMNSFSFMQVLCDVMNTEEAADFDIDIEALLDDDTFMPAAAPE